MAPKSDNSTAENVGFSLNGHPDPYLAGEAVLDRAKSVAQRIADRVRHLTGENGAAAGLSDQAPPTDGPDATGERTSLSD